MTDDCASILCDKISDKHLDNAAELYNEITKTIQGFAERTGLNGSSLIALTLMLHLYNTARGSDRPFEQNLTMLAGIVQHLHETRRIRRIRSEAERRV